MGLTFQPDQFSTVFWDVFGEQGHPVRATVSEMGPLLLSRMIDLNDVQEGVLNVAFKVADDKGLAADRHEGSAGDADAIVPIAGTSATRRSADRPQYGNVSAMYQARSAPSSASFWCWKTRAATSFSASRRCR